MSPLKKLARRYWIKMIGLRSFLGFLFVTCLLAAAPAVAAESVPLTIEAGGSTYRFTVEIADDPAERSQGLMFREHLDENAGMLFLYPDERPRTFWMKNTPLPLDIIFIDRNGLVVHVAAEARPFDLTTIESVAPAQSALEVRGGLAAQLGIGPGAKVTWLPRDTAPQP
jgi:uncharacterized membrane protein (UPF0127 family)